ncbi:lamin-B2-like isoform X2 [Mugil cephalus]|uniref:lamin-B2-like isoform X2 n=1 Tax=Mugil cephalus TaxID=48193 RepID=UPI001FB68AC4|nr:lamin-B2-like isoform X2 [Mugil cephalus]
MIHKLITRRGDCSTEQVDDMHPTFHLSFAALLVFHLLLTQVYGGQSELIGSSQPIVATLGEDVVLPCYLQPAEDATDLTVEWTRPDLDPRFVHVWRSQQELVGKKHMLFEGRTSLFIDELTKGNISLKLSEVKLSDEGHYKCFIPSPGKQTFVQLCVASVPVSSPIISLSGMDRDRGGVVLQCESRGWYPEPEVLWLDAEGNLLSAGPPETVRGPDDLYTVSSRVTVDKRHNNSFTCRIQQNDIYQTREAHIHVPDDFFLSSSSSAVPINTGLAVSLAVTIMVILACVFFVWRQNRTKTKKRSRDEAERGEKLLTEETVKMKVLGGRKNKMKDLTEKYEKIEEELLKTKEELMIKTEEMRLQLENEAEKVDKLMADNKKLEEEKEQLQKIKAELEHKAAASKNPFLSWLPLNANKQQKMEVEPVKQEIHQQEAEMKWKKITEELEEKRVELENKTVALDQTKRHADDLLAENSTLREEISQLQEENKGIKRAEDELTDKADELLAENKKLEQETWRLQEDNKAIRELKAMLDDELEKHINSGKDQEEKYLKEIEEWEKKLKEEEVKRETAEKELEELRRKLDIKLEEIKPEQTHLQDSLANLNGDSSDSQETSGDITVEVDPNNNFICLRNESEQDKPLGGRQLKVQINNKKSITYKFDPSMELKAGKSVTLWCKGCGQHHPDTGELVWKDLKSWKPGDRVQATLQ